MGPIHFFVDFQFYDEITRKLLITLANVQHQRNDLIEIVKRKDMEINQYKIEGATLMRSKFSSEINLQRGTHKLLNILL